MTAQGGTPAPVSEITVEERAHRIDAICDVLVQHEGEWPWQLAGRLVDAGWTPPVAEETP